eukprot:CAMPEP_0178950776 /NCGR_PEP_ID=MMETSP0789-20121207/6842_1 /TAXON_ID=3005 /ORGANISM="Rhizosolenia setigera, Strain CCMP 1694" /LENGTH=940 /DNA_ID=CAMNT_0020631543 /DNA_START=1071 /DNA_END=3894 /DNA_ORIENTATION=-
MSEITSNNNSNNNNIDQIWMEMKKKETVATFKHKKKKSKRTTKKAKNLKSDKDSIIYEILQINNNRGIDSSYAVHEKQLPSDVSSKVKATSNLLTSPPSPFTSWNDTLTSLLLSKENDENANPNDESDYESDLDHDEKPDVQPRSGHQIRLQRILSAISSSNFQLKKTALYTLLEIIINTRPNPLEPFASPSLKLPLPYHIDHIALTHSSSSVVSDLPSEKFVPRWGLWQRTHVNLMDQFATTNRTDTADATSSSKKDVKSKQESSESDNNKSTSSRFLLIKRIWKMFSPTLFQSLSSFSGAEIHREASCQIVHCLLLDLEIQDITTQIAYLIPALANRNSSLMFDPDLDLFVSDSENLDFYKRGGCISKQTLQVSRVGGKESEEIQLWYCRIIETLISRYVVNADPNKINILLPHAQDILFHLLPLTKTSKGTEIQIFACTLLTQILRIPQWHDPLTKHLAVAITRYVLPSLRSLKSSVRMATLDLVEISISIPDKSKIRGAGTQAIQDLIGFSQEENKLAVNQFFGISDSTKINYLAFLLTNSNQRVRARVCSMLSYFMVCLPNRHDYHSRFLPYILTFLEDSSEETTEMAFGCLQNCGEQYEAEHPQDVIELRQYGLDGSGNQRYSLGTRLFVRQHICRFFHALLKEIDSSAKDWMIDAFSTQRQSLKLLKTILEFYEEHLTMEFHHTLHILARAFMRMRRKKDQSKSNETNDDYFYEIFQIMGTYVEPKTFVPFILSQLKTPSTVSTTTSTHQVEDVDPNITKTTTTMALPVSYSEDGYHSTPQRAAYLYILGVMWCSTHDKCVGDEKHHYLKSVLDNILEIMIGDGWVGTVLMLECMHTLFRILEHLVEETQQAEERQQLITLEEVTLYQSHLEQILIHHCPHNAIEEQKESLNAMQVIPHSAIEEQKESLNASASDDVISMFAQKCLTKLSQLK